MNRTGETPVPLFRCPGSWSQCIRESERGLSMKRRWYGVPPSGGHASPDRLKPELHAVGSSWSQYMRKKAESGLSINLRVLILPAVQLHRTALPAAPWPPRPNRSVGARNLFRRNLEKLTM